MIVEVFHALNEDAAFQKLRKGVEDLSKSNAGRLQDFSANWGHRAGQITCSIRGIRVSVKLNMVANKVVIEGRVPLAFLVFKKQIAETIKDKVQKILL